MERGSEEKVDYQRICADLRSTDRDDFEQWKTRDG